MKVLFITLHFRYNKSRKRVNCKSEGNLLGIENEEKGDAHFCK